jgi:hypothetical protein
VSFQLPSNCLPTAFQLPSNCLPTAFQLPVCRTPYNPHRVGTPPTRLEPSKGVRPQASASFFRSRDSRPNQQPVVGALLPTCLTARQHVLRHLSAQ